MKTNNFFNNKELVDAATERHSYDSVIAEMERYRDWLNDASGWDFFNPLEPGGGGGGSAAGGGGGGGGTPPTTETTPTDTTPGGAVIPENKPTLDDEANNYWDELQDKKTQTAGFGGTWLLLAAAAIGAYSLRKQILK